MLLQAPKLMYASSKYMGLSENVNPQVCHTFLLSMKLSCYINLWYSNIFYQYLGILSSVTYHWPSSRFAACSLSWTRPSESSASLASTWQEPEKLIQSTGTGGTTLSRASCLDTWAGHVSVLGATKWNDGQHPAASMLQRHLGREVYTIRSSQHHSHEILCIVQVQQAFNLSPARSQKFQGHSR